MKSALKKGENLLYELKICENGRFKPRVKSGEKLTKSPKICYTVGLFERCHKSLLETPRS